MSCSFRPGEPIAWRCSVRIDRSRVDHASYAVAMTIVHDTPTEVAVLRRPGHPIKIRNADLGGPVEQRHRPVLRWRDGWSDDTWATWRVLILKRPHADHSISLFWRDDTDEFDFWYIDLTSPLRRTLAGFDFVESGLEVVVRPDMSSWHWKDRDELEWAVEDGRYTRSEADALYAEGERAVQRLLRDRARFEQWIDWRPDLSWPLATVPTGWDPT